MAHLFVAMQFGIYTAAFMFLAYKGGLWLDLKYGTYPLFTMLAILISVVYSFSSLIHKMNLINEYSKKKDSK